MTVSSCGVSTEARWTLDELVRRVAAALAGPAYPGSPNGRVRDVPDRRAVRWYVTIGLVDRPAAMQGRTALYGTRHLLQIVAVKRRQAQGRSLAEIQAELAGATDETLRQVAIVPEELIQREPEPQVAAIVGERLEEAPRPARRGRFWTDRPAAHHGAASAATVDGGVDSVSVLAAVGLPGGAVLLLPGRLELANRPDDADVAAIRAAARPLLDLLANRGLLEHEEWSP
jgi:DNA-binding transcriptional MerR regulator